MNSNSLVNKSKTKDPRGLNQKSGAEAFDWDFRNYFEKNTILNSEKVLDGGYPLEREIVCKRYDPHLDDFITIHAVATNIHKQGFIFVTSQPLEVDDPIFIKAKNPSIETHNDELDEGIHARVIWSKKTLDRKHDLCYEVGIEYFG
jgi:hypothetical protein